MTSVAASHGYSGASVARVCRSARVSRPTFYEYFSDRSACFHAAYLEAQRVILGPLVGSVDAAAPVDPERSLREFLDSVVRFPEAARLVLVEAVGACETRAEHQRALDEAAPSFRDSLGEGGERSTLALPPQALISALVDIATKRLLGSETESLPELARPFLDFVHCFAWTGDGKALQRLHDLGREIPSPARIPTAERPSPLLPRGPSALPTEVATSIRRQRIIAAIIELCATRGYAGLTVQEVLATARVPRAAFYANFASKQDAFLEAQTQGLKDAIAVTASHFFGAQQWPQRVWDGLHALLDFLTANPSRAAMAMVEPYAAGRTAILRAFSNRIAYALFLEEGYRFRREPEDHLPRLTSEAIVGAVYGLLRSEILAERGHRLHQVLPACAFVTLAPFLGPEAAMAFVEAQAQAAR